MKKILLLLVAMLAATTVWATDFITDVMVIGGSKSEVNNLKTSYMNQGWLFIDQDLNAGCGSGSDYIYMLYRTGDNTSQDAGAFITDFYISTESGTVPDNFVHNGRTYTLVPYDGSTYFKNNKGDLNSHCGSGSAYIHLYYCKDDNENYRSTAVTSITFNDTQNWAVGANGGTTGYDLNTGCGSGSDYIYMHTATAAKGWTIAFDPNSSQCIITGYQGTKTNKTSLTVPLYIDGAQVANFEGSVFSGFTKLETLAFNDNTIVSQMPSMQGCSKFKHVKTGSINDRTPTSMKSIPASAFMGTAIENITLPSVTSVGANAFQGCGTLNSVIFNKEDVTIGNGAFSFIVKAGGAMCQITYPGSIDKWNGMMVMCSPSVIVNGTSGNSAWYCGWCGGGSSSSYNRLFWKLDAAGQLKIDCADNSWTNHLSDQVIIMKEWNKNLVKSLTLDHVYSLGTQEFANHANLKNVYINPTLHSIGNSAFSGCNSLTDVWFDGTQAQWADVAKGSSWKPDATKEHWRCTVTFNANGHGTAPASQTLWSNYDKATAPTPPTAAAYSFQGWFTEAACTNPWDFNTVVPGDMTLYAKWVLRYTFDNTTGELALLWGEFNSGNKWGSDVPADSVKSVTATSQVSFTGDCSELFKDFNHCLSMDLDSVNTSTVTNMRCMFQNCGPLFTFNISNWDTGNVTNMKGMFKSCSISTSNPFNISNWNTGNVTDMSEMFLQLNILTKSLDLSDWDTGKVTNMSYMFYNSNSLTSLNITNWDTGSVTDMCWMFAYCVNLSSLNLSGWNTSKVGDMTYMFCACSSLKMLNLTGWDTGNVTGSLYMFSGCGQLTTIYASTNWDVGNVVYSSNMFGSCTKLVGGMGTTFDENFTDKTYARIDRGTAEPGYFTGVFTLTLPGNVTAAATPIFTLGDTTSYYTAGTTVTLTYTGDVPAEYCHFFVNGEEIDGNTFQMPLDDVIVTVGGPRYVFDSETGELKLLWGEFNSANKWGDDVSPTAVKSVTATSEVSFTGDCWQMFYDFYHCESMDLSKVNTSNATNTGFMFQECANLTSLDISGWNTSRVTETRGMFYCCEKLSKLDISSFNTASVRDMRYMFSYCIRLTTIYAGPEWSTVSVTQSDEMFRWCQMLVGGMGTTYDENHIDMEYAHIDGGTDNPGYFTDKNAVVVVPGDVDGDGTVTAADITALYSFLLSGDTSGLENGDQDGDGNITSADVTAVYSILLGN
ncbi:MAG: BspA family leucine-rich repeat surface protein [Muribaculaceae bacterium]|nr:BspA family leucine-rich repeat surface protein [Muribaculaceae bacterium]